MKKTIILVTVTCFFSTLAVLAQEPPAVAENVPAMATSSAAVSEGETISLTGHNEQTAGTVEVLDGPHGKVLTLEVNGMSEGWHGFHIHQVGDCSDRETFESAGAHASAPGQVHGFLSENTPHTGDLPNIWVNETGTGKAQYYVPKADWEKLRDQDGSAFVLHTDEDDYKTDPSGQSGTRVACGVIAPAVNP